VFDPVPAANVLSAQVVHAVLPVCVCALGKRSSATTEAAAGQARPWHVLAGRARGTRLLLRIVIITRGTEGARCAVGYGRAVDTELAARLTGHGIELPARAQRAILCAENGGKPTRTARRACTLIARHRRILRGDEQAANEARRNKNTETEAQTLKKK